MSFCLVNYCMIRGCLVFKATRLRLFFKLCLLCGIHIHTVAIIFYFAHSSYNSPAKITENVLAFAVLQHILLI